MLAALDRREIRACDGNLSPPRAEMLPESDTAASLAEPPSAYGVAQDFHPGVAELVSLIEALAVARALR